MDLEVVARHALLFDDDAMAAFVNSGDALVDWHSLKIDRYDVRHLLSAPPPPRRRNRSYEPRASEDPSVEFLIDQERYLDLPLETEQTGLEEGEKPSSSGGYQSVAFSYGNTDDATDQKNTDIEKEASGYLPPFFIPRDIVQSLPPTEKAHQIIARTATFVSKHGGQSEIILRVKQGDNPTFGFLMPDHHLHAYFRYLVEHPELVLSEIDEKSQDGRKTAGTEHSYPDNVGGALSLLGSVYGSGDDDDDGDHANAHPSHDARNMESEETAAKDESTFRKPILSKIEKVPAVKKNSSILGSKPKIVKGTKKEDNSGVFSTVEEKLKTHGFGAASKQILEPPPEIKRLIDKLVEFVMRNGKQFEATILEQDSKLERFSFLLPSNQYHPYYLKALQTAEESKLNGKSFYSGQEDQSGRGMSKRAPVLKENHTSQSASEFFDVPFESDKKEKFKMVIGKSKKEAHETEKESQESGFTVDAAAAAAILQAATKGMRSSGLQIIRSTAANSQINENGQPANSDSPQTLQPYSATEKSDHLKTGTTTHAAAGGVNSSDANLTEEQKLKAERLKRAKMFVAMLKSGAPPSRTGTSRGSSAEPIEPGMLKSVGEVSRASQEREGSQVHAAVDKPAAKANFGQRLSERSLKRKYRSRSIGSEDDEEDSLREGHSSRKDESHSRRHRETKSLRSHHSQGDEDEFEGECKEKGDEKDNEHHLERAHRSRSHMENEEVGNVVEKDRKHHRKRRNSHSSSEESESEERGELVAEHKHYKAKHRSRHSQRDDNEREGIYKEERDKKYRKNSSRRSSGSKSRGNKDKNGTGNAVEKEDRYNRRKHSSHSSDDDNGGGESTGDDKDDGREDIYKERKDHKRSRKSHRSRHSSSESPGRHSFEGRKKHRSSHSKHHSKDKDRYRDVHSSRDKDSRRHHKHDSSSDDEYEHRASTDQSRKELHVVRNELEEGEISYKVSKGITSGEGKRVASVDVISCQQRAPSQPSETTEVPADLRAKIRAMLMATQS